MGPSRETQGGRESEREKGGNNRAARIGGREPCSCYRSKTNSCSISFFNCLLQQTVQGRIQEPSGKNLAHIVSRLKYFSIFPQENDNMGFMSTAIICVTGCFLSRLQIPSGFIYPFFGGTSKRYLREVAWEHSRAFVATVTYLCAETNLMFTHLLLQMSEYAQHLVPAGPRPRTWTAGTGG